MDRPTSAVTQLHQPPTDSAPDPAGRGWYDPTQADLSDSQHRVQILWRLLLLLAIAMADLVFIKSTFDHLLRQLEVFSWLAAAAITLGSIATAALLGTQLRTLSALGHQRGRVLAAIGLATVWAALGITLFTLRWNSADLVPPQAAYDGLTATGAGLDQAREQVLAVAMAAVYLVTGALAAFDGWHLKNDAATAMRTARRRTVELAPRTEQAEGTVRRLYQALARRHDEQATRIEHDSDIAHRAADALADEAQAHARVLIAAHLGDPASAGVVHQSIHAPLRSGTSRHTMADRTD